MLGDNIRKYRKLNNMSQDELAEKLEVTRQSISLWETGQTQPSLENIIALSKLFNVSTDELLVADKTELSTSNTVASPNKENPPKKPKIFFLILCVALAVVLVTVAVVLLGGNNGSENNTDQNSKQTTASTTSSTNNTSVADPDKNEKDIFGYLKDFVIEKGIINGDYCYYSKSADNYGGYASESFSLYYWGDTNKIEFCLHSVINDTFSINFYLYVPEEHNGSYEYITSYYYRDNGESLYEARGTINAENFTDNYPLNCTKYIGATSEQNAFMEMTCWPCCAC